MHDQRRVERRGREQIGDRNRIQRDRDAFGDAVLADDFRRELAARVGDALADLIGQATGEEARIERRERLAFALDDRRESRSRNAAMSGACSIELGVLDAVGIDADALLRRRLRADRDDIVRAHEPARVLAQAFEQALALVVAVTVGLVQREQQRTLGAREQAQRVELALRHVAVDDEHDEIADRRRLRNASFSRASPSSSSMPGVSIRCTPLPATSRHARCAASRVVPCSTPTVKASSPSSALASADLPTLTRPNTAMCSSPRLELAEHRFEPREIGREIRADRRRNVRVVEQRAQALRGLHAVRVAARAGHVAAGCAAHEPLAQRVATIAWLDPIAARCARSVHGSSSRSSTRCACTGTSAPTSAQSPPLPSPKSARLSVVSTSSVAALPVSANLTLSVTGLVWLRIVRLPFASTLPSAALANDSVTKCAFGVFAVSKKSLRRQRLVALAAAGVDAGEIDRDVEFRLRRIGARRTRSSRRTS